MNNLPWHTPARLFDRVDNKHYSGTLQSALQRWIHLPRDAQALAIVNVEANGKSNVALRAADIREMLLDRDIPIR